MTATFSLVLAALISSGEASEPRSAAATKGEITKTEAAFKSLNEAREAVTRALRESNRANHCDAGATAMSLVSTYQQLARSETIPAADRNRLLARLRSRLTEQELALRRETQNGSTFAGGVSNDAEMLLELIQTTIAPESWEINGGRGSIYFFPNR